MLTNPTKCLSCCLVLTWLKRHLYRSCGTCVIPFLTNQWLVHLAFVPIAREYL